MPYSPEAEVLAANEAFYEAFARGDLAAIEALWAESAPIACIHPGWDALEGRDEVLESWRAILGDGDPPSIRCARPQVHVLGDSAFVICAELLAGTELVATNVFVREGGRWRLAHHQAGPVNRRTRSRPKRSKPPPGLLN